MKSDDLYWRRVEVYKLMHGLLESFDATVTTAASEEINMSKIKELIKTKLILHEHDRIVDKTDL